MYKLTSWHYLSDLDENRKDEWMTIIKCDRCGREMGNMNDVFMVQGYKYSKPSREVKYDLCEWCFRCVTDEVINGKAREVCK